MTTYRVIKIISESQLVINAGYSNDIKKNDIFEIYSVGEEVYDPVSGYSLGTLDVIKATIRAVVVYEKMCICVNRENDTKGTSLATAGLILNLYNHKPKELNVDPTEISGGLASNDIIKIGDKVRKFPDSRPSDSE